MSPVNAVSLFPLFRARFRVQCRHILPGLVPNYSPTAQASSRAVRGGFLTHVSAEARLSDVGMTGLGKQHSCFGAQCTT